MNAAPQQGGRGGISVCIATYNREATIDEALDSVLAQTRPADEIVVVDDASTDRTADRVLAFGGRVRLLRRAQNSGRPAVARNEAIRAATGDYLALLDSDDTMAPDRLARQADHLDRHPDHAFCHGYLRYMDADSRPGAIRHEGAIPPSGRCLEAMLTHCYVSTSAVMMRSAVLQRSGLFNEAKERTIGEDYELFVRLAAVHAIGFIPDVLGCYRAGAQGISQRPEAWRQQPADVVTHRGFLDLPELRDRRALVKATLARKLVDNAIHWRERGYPDRAWWFVRMGLVTGAVDAGLLAEAAKSLLARAGVRRPSAK